jgi:hypothetical protein
MKLQSLPNFLFCEFVDEASLAWDLQIFYVRLLQDVVHEVTDRMIEYTSSTWTKAG